MRILFIGGTRFVGKAIASEAIARGHDVTVFHRGNTTLPSATSVIGDRDADLSALASGSWDATVDVCGYRPHQIDQIAESLGARAGRYVFISSVSAYSPEIPPLSVESAALADTREVSADPAGIAMTGDTYGPLKAMCEQATLRHYQEALIIRPTYVIGPDDYTMRFPAWVERLVTQQEVECPGPENAPMQYVDVRDQAMFVVDAIESGLSGAFHCAAPHTTFGHMVTTIRDVVAPTAAISWLPAADCEGRETEFPLWAGGESSPLMQMNPAAAIAAGLVLRPLADTVRDTAVWLDEQSQK